MRTYILQIPIDHTVLKQREKKNICETSAYYVQQNKIKNQNANIHNINFSKANDRNNSNANYKFTTLNLKVNIFMRTYTLQIPVDHTVLKKRKNENICETSAYYVQQNKIKNQNANIHNMNFSKANDRNITNAIINKFTTLNLKSNIIMRTYICGIAFKGTRIKSA